MLSRARTLFRKLRGSGRHSSRGNEPTSSAPTTTAESKDVDPPPRAIHYTDQERSPTGSTPKRVFRSQSMSIIIVNAKGASNQSRFYDLLLNEKRCGFDPTHCFDTFYYCGNCKYDVEFLPCSTLGHAPILSYMQHAGVVFIYDASSRESWDELAAACDRMQSRCTNGVFPFFGMIAAMGEGEDAVSHAEVEKFATEHKCLFAKFSPATGHGICDAVGSLVELAHGAHDQYSLEQDGLPQRQKRAKIIAPLYSSLGSLSQENDHHR